jgi:hypothetical protein
MWQLAMTNAAKEWVVVGRFDSVTDAARRIRELEGPGDRRGFSHGAVRNRFW